MALQQYSAALEGCLSSSALASPQQGFGTCRLLGFVLASCRGTDAACRDSDVPHLALEQTLLGDKLQGIITLWPRQSYSNDLDYLHRYFSAAPDGSGLRCYNDIQNEAYEASERPGWRHYQPPAAEVKPLLAASIAYTFPAEEDNLLLFRSWALEVAALWAAFLQQGGCPAKGPAALHRFDSRYFSCITTDPGNHLAVKLFGEQTTDKLLKMATGHPAVAS
ncbi:hypothetical protein COHA_004657 [Chlorella ohadii]|uniref:Uncharacterized protein n=1 Tax=Chlorella ohadii TaxID=2649997 RepID=A0AAD5DP82_9CHLO|nr:hypothetical protein COHA_004657 [Chlorella ohadii]